MTDPTEQMQDLTIGKTAVFAPKKPAGTKGEKRGIQTNLAKMELKPNMPFYKYDICIIGKFPKADGSFGEKEITKPTKDDAVQQLRKAATVAVFKAAIEKGGKLFDSASTFYDRSKVLFSLKKLDIDGEKIISVTATIPDIDITTWEFKIKPCAESFQTSTNDLGKVVNANESMVDKTICEALNLVCSKSVMLKPDEFITYGTRTHYLLDPSKFGFKPTDTPNLPDGKKIMVAVAKNVTVLEGEDKKPTAYLTTEIKKSSVHCSEPLSQKIQAYSFMNRRFDGPSVYAAMRQLKPLLKGLSVYPSYAKKKVFQISGLTESTPRQFSFETKGKKMTVEQYYRNEKNITLKYPDMPMVTAFERGQLCQFPIEVLVVAPHQRVINSQTTPEEMQIAIKASATLPADRLRQTQKMKEAMQLTSTNKELIQSGVKVADKMTVAPGRVLPDPQIVYGSGNLKVAGHCKWRADNSKYHSAAGIKSWWLISNLADGERRLDSRTVDAFGERLVRQARAKGMNMSDRVLKVINPSLQGVEEIFAQAKNEGIGFLLFVSSDKLKFHEHIKHLEVQYQILTQEVKAGTAAKVADGGQSNTMENIVNKLNEKNGGLGYVIQGVDNNWVNDPTKFFVGFEMSHPPPLTGAEIARGVKHSTPSILGYSANYGRLPQQFLGDYLYVEPRSTAPMGEKIAEIMPMILKSMRADRAKQPCGPPLHIIIYYHGISEGQYSEIATTFKDYLRKGLDALSPAYNPKVTMIAVSKNHNQRFYTEQIRGEKAWEQNILPGTVVDQVVVNPCINEFYLTAHSAFQGTAKSPKYTVIYDNSSSTMDQIEGATHALCYLHEIVTATVSLPAPLIVADRCAKRGSKVFHDMQQSTASTAPIDLAQLNAELTNKDKKLAKYRYNA